MTQEQIEKVAMDAAVSHGRLYDYKEELANMFKKGVAFYDQHLLIGEIRKFMIFCISEEKGHSPEWYIEKYLKSKQ